MCEERRKQARDAGGKEGLWAVGWGAWKSRAGEGGEADVWGRRNGGRMKQFSKQTNNNNKTRNTRRWWSGELYQRERWGYGESSGAIFSAQDNL